MFPSCFFIAQRKRKDKEFTEKNRLWIDSVNIFGKNGKKDKRVGNG